MHVDEICAINSHLLTPYTRLQIHFTHSTNMKEQNISAPLVATECEKAVTVATGTRTNDVERAAVTAGGDSTLVDHGTMILDSTISTTTSIHDVLQDDNNGNAPPNYYAKLPDVSILFKLQSSRVCKCCHDRCWCSS